MYLTGACSLQAGFTGKTYHTSFSLSSSIQKRWSHEHAYIKASLKISYSFIITFIHFRNCILLDNPTIANDSYSKSIFYVYFFLFIVATKIEQSFVSNLVQNYPKYLNLQNFSPGTRLKKTSSQKHSVIISFITLF